jgi:hypothetical protein
LLAYHHLACTDLGPLSSMAHGSQCIISTVMHSLTTQSLEKVLWAPSSFRSYLPRRRIIRCREKILLVCAFDETRNEYHDSNGTDCVVQMITKLRELSDRCIAEMRTNQGMTFTREDKINFKDAETCYLCEGEFTEKNWKVRDHDHRTGHYRTGMPQQMLHLTFHKQISARLLSQSQGLRQSSHLTASGGYSG